jgi:hypothetical protein
MKKVKFNGVEITFDDLEFQRLTEAFECRGEDSKGNFYSGIITKSCGEYGDITDIELVKRAEDRQSLNFDCDPQVMGDAYNL